MQYISLTPQVDKICIIKKSIKINLHIFRGLVKNIYNLDNRN